MSTRDAQSTSTIYYNCNNTEQDDDNDNNIRPNEPLLSSLYKKNVKVGPFSIKYDDPSIPKAKPMRLYNGEEDDEIDGGSKEKQYHDFTVRSSIFDKEDNYDDGEDNEDFLHNTTRYRRYFPIIIQSLLTKCLPLRILLLSLYLATTLSTFWILDSIKEPTLAILVNGELGKHQPRAKILSFVVVVILAVGMEYMDRLKLKKRRRGQQQVGSKRSGDNIHDGAEDDQNNDSVSKNTNESDVNAAIEQSWADRNLPLSMQNNNNESSRWKKMKTRTSYFWKRRHLFHHFTGNNSDDDQDDSSENKNGSSSSKITTLAFYIVGSLYIHFFVTVALALKTPHTSTLIGCPEKLGKTAKLLQWLKRTCNPLVHLLDRSFPKSCGPAT